MSVLKMNKFGEIIESGFGESQKFHGRLSHSKYFGIMAGQLGEPLDPGYDKWTDTQQYDWMYQHADVMRKNIYNLRNKILQALKNDSQKKEEERIMSLYNTQKTAWDQRLRDFENDLKNKQASMLPEEFEALKASYIEPEKQRINMALHEITEHRDTMLLSAKSDAQIKLEQAWADFDNNWFKTKISTADTIGDRAAKAESFKALWQQLNDNHDQLENYYKSITTANAAAITQVSADKLVVPSVSKSAVSSKFMQHPLINYFTK